MQSLIVPATLDSLKRIRGFVMAVAQAAGLDQKTACRLRLGVDEIATNAIEHGYAETKSEEILHISAETDEQTFKIVLEDRGKPYDPNQALPLNDLDLPLEERQAGGLGIYLTLQAVDEFFYERVGDWNRITFVIKREQHSGT